MSSWQTPKTNWGQPGQTVPGVNDFNRIEGNAQHLNDTLASHKATSATTSQKGHVQLSNSTSSTSTSLAATASAVKTVNDALVSHMADYVLQTGYATTTGSANNYAVTLNPAPASLVEGLCVAVKIHVTNTGTSTLNVNGKGAKTIKKPNGNNLVSGNLKAGSVYTVRYNGTNFILQGSDSSGNATPGDVTAGKTFSNDDDTDLVGTLPILGNRSTTLIINGPGTPQVVIPSGRIDQSTIVAKIDPSKASIIKLGETLGGVTGALKPFARESGTVSIQYVGREFTPSSITVSGLPFAPETIIIEMLNDYWFDRGGYANGNFSRADLYFRPGTSVKSMRYNDDSASPYIFTISISRGTDGFTMSFSVSAASTFNERTLNLRWTAMSY